VTGFGVGEGSGVKVGSGVSVGSGLGSSVSVGSVVATSSIVSVAVGCLTRSAELLMAVAFGVLVTVVLER
jgi:hypothetical protein